MKRILNKFVSDVFAVTNALALAIVVLTKVVFVVTLGLLLTPVALAAMAVSAIVNLCKKS